MVDLVTEDHAAEETERVRARKEGGARWNEDEQKHFVRNYEDREHGLDIRQGFEPSQIPPASAAASDSNFAIIDDDDDDDDDDDNSSDQAPRDQKNAPGKSSSKFGDHLDDRNVWNEA